MKRIEKLLILLLSIACLSLVACRDEENEKQKTEIVKPVSFQSLFDMCGKSTASVDSLLKSQGFRYYNHFSSTPLVIENYIKIINKDTVAYMLGTYDGIVVAPFYYIPVNNRTKAHSSLIDISKEAYNFVNTENINEYESYIDDSLGNSTNYYNHNDFLSALKSFDANILEYCYEYTNYDDGNKIISIDYNWLCLAEEFRLINDADDEMRNHFIGMSVMDANTFKKKSQTVDIKTLRASFKH